MKIKYIINENGRECSCCRKFLPWTEYHLNTSKSTKHCAKCKECANMKRRLYPSYKKVSQLIIKKTNSNMYKPKYPAPNIDEIIGFVPIVKQEDLDY